MDLLKWLCSIAVAAFIAGAGATYYLNSHVDSRIDLKLESKGISQLPSRVEDLERKEISVSFSEQLIGVEDRIHNIGKHKFCSLSEAATVHAVQACGCVISQSPEGMWSLKIDAAQTLKESECRCRAVCID